MKVDSFKCDGPGCSNLKGAANHWFRVKVSTGEFHIVKWNESGTCHFQEIDIQEFHVCSESCAAKLMSKAIGAGVSAGSGE